LNSRAGNLGGEETQGGRCAADSHHDAEERRKYAQRFIVHVIDVVQERLPAVDVGELLHHPEGMDIELGDVSRHRSDHGKPARQTGGERQCRGLSGLEFDDPPGDLVEHSR
jgi:hypothetical protein